MQSEPGGGPLGPDLFPLVLQVAGPASIKYSKKITVTLGAVFSSVDKPRLTRVRSARAFQEAGSFLGFSPHLVAFIWDDFCSSPRNYFHISDAFPAQSHSARIESSVQCVGAIAVCGVAPGNPKTFSWRSGWWCCFSGLITHDNIFCHAAHIPLYLYPFLNTVSKNRPFEYLRLTSLGVIGALVKVLSLSLSLPSNTSRAFELSSITVLHSPSNMHSSMIQRS